MDPRSVLQGVVILIAAALLFYLAYDYYQQKLADEEEEEGTNEGFLEYSSLEGPSKEAELAPVEPAPMVPKTTARPVEGGVKSKEIKRDCFPKDKLTPEDLLPRDAANSEWAQVNPAGQGDVKNQNYLTAGYHMGINSIGSTLRNPNMQLRSEPPNPQVKVSPWLQTTIDPDLNRRPLEVEGCSA